MSNFTPVLLPKTDYVSHYNKPSELDGVTLSMFDDVFKERQQMEKERDVYHLHDGPPYANGYVHMGHAVNKVLKDFVSRSRFLMGKSSLFRPGWDCHGLPIEWKVQELFESKGLNYRDVPVLEFRKECRDYAKYWVLKQMDGMKRLGVMADWNNPYLTMSQEGDAGTLKVLFELFNKGMVYTSERPVLWSVPEQTVMANAEVEYKNVRYQSLLVKFPVMSYKNTKAHLSKYLTDAYVVCWTSTPWSLPGNRAVACNANETYCVIKVTEVTEGAFVHVGDKLVVAECLVPQLVDKAKVLEYDLVEYFQGEVLEDMVVQHPLYDDRHVKVLCADFVRNDSGTGFVHVAPSLGPDDFYFAKSCGLELDVTLDADGTYNSSVPKFAGLSVLKSDGAWGEGQGAVLSALKDNGNMVAVWNDKHSAAHSWRSGAPLLYRTTKQWFVKAKGKLVDNSMNALNEVSFYPSDSKNRLEGMLKTRPDWCVSRQRSWGVPMAFFVNKKTGDVLSDENVFNRTLALFGEHGSDCWYYMDNHVFFANMDEYNPDDYKKVMDVLDVWFESGATWSWVMGDNKVADLYLEGSDQHRGWFQSSLLESVALKGESPYRNLFTHGFVLDAKGRKMSKSLGNVVNPMDVADKYGADVLRWWIACSDVTNDVSYADKQMMSHVQMVKKFRNTFRWFLGVLNSQETLTVFDYDDLSHVDQLMLSRLYEVNEQVIKSYEEYDFNRVTRLVRDFVLNDMSAVWMNMKKDSVYCDALNSKERQQTVYVADCLFNAMASWFSPLLPLMVEQVWTYYVHKNRNHACLGSFQLPLKWSNTTDEWSEMCKLRDMVLLFAEHAQKDTDLKSLNEMKATVNTNMNVPDLDMAMVTGLSCVVVNKSDKEDVVVEPVNGQKCERCWKYLPDVKNGLCMRCSHI